MNPIPPGVLHLKTIGEYNLTGSSLVIIFDETPSLFPRILATRPFNQSVPEDRENYERNYFVECPPIDNPVYFDDLAGGDYTPSHVIKTNEERSKVYYAFTRD